MNTLVASDRIFRGQLKLYEVQAEQAESWKNDHDRAMDCLELDGLVGFGLHLYDWLCRTDNILSRSVLEQKMQFSDQAAKKLAEWYAWWLEPCDSVLKEIDKFEAEGYQVHGADRFRRACQDVRAILSIPVERVLAVSKRLEQGNGSKPRPATEVRDALRRKLREGSGGGH